MAEEKSEVREITREALVEKRRRGEPFVLVDVLSHEHFEHIHLPGAVNVPLPVLRDLAPVLFGKHDQLVTYCANSECTASATAAKLLVQLGFTDVYEYTGGITDWIDGGQPVVHMPHEPPSSQAA